MTVTKLTKNQKNAKAMIAAFIKMGVVSRATNAEVRQAIYDLADIGDHEGVNLLIFEEARRTGALVSLKTELARIALKAALARISAQKNGG